MTYEIKETCCFTGHRPERLGAPESDVKKWLEREIYKSYENGYRTFISGMQRGVDLWAADVVLKMKKDGLPVRLVAACAFKDMAKGWKGEWRALYDNAISGADEVVNVSEFPGKAAYIKRDEWMVDRSSRILAVFTGAPGGTQKTIQYAEKKNRNDIVKRKVILMELP